MAANRIGKILTREFGIVASAPNGIQKLRGLILDLAVRGKLVPQNSSDEPASKLLKRMHADNAGTEISHNLPAGWVLTTLPQITTYKVGKTPPTKDSKFWSDDIPWVSISDMPHYGVVSKTSRKVSNLAQKNIFKHPPVPAGTLLMSFKLTVGKVSILGVDAFHNEAIISISPHIGINKDYLFRILPQIALAGNSKKAIKGNTLNSESIALLAIPLPPSNEQERIVAKIDELMALCDRMEAQQADAKSAHENRSIALPFSLRVLTASFSDKTCVRVVSRC